MIREVYLDNSATTRVRDGVAAVVLETMTRYYGNPSSLHQMGMEAEGLVKEAREILARSLGVKVDTIYFTSGGTEANNLALKGGARARCRRARHIISTAIEHPSVLNACSQLEEEGFQLTLLPVDGTGILDPEVLKAHLTPETILVSTMYVNNEIGSIQPLAEIAALLREWDSDILWHVDAIQGFGKLPLKPRELGIHLLSLSGHKFHGPKGIGALYVAENVRLKPLLAGGGQEKDLRPGTENVPGIVGLGRAAQMAGAEREEALARMESLKERLIEGILTQVPGTRLNGPREGGAPHIVNVTFARVRGETLVQALGEVGIYVSTGSACSSRQRKANHVLQALGIEEEDALGTLRFSLSPFNQGEEIDYVLGQLPGIVEELRLFYRR